MAKGTGVRQREKKKKSSSLYYKEVACSSSVKPANEQKIKENLLTENFWKYCCFSLLLLLGVLCVLLSRNLRSSSRSSLYRENVGFPCNFGDEFSIDRRSNLSLEEFIYCYDAKRPVLITDVMRKWRAMSWTKSFLVSNYGEKRVSMRATEGALHEAKGFAVPLNMFARHAHEGKPRLWTYLEDELFIEMNPELREHLGQPVYLNEDFFQLLPKEIRPWNAMLLWGTAHSRSTLHIDPYNWTGTNAVLSGRKMWKLYPPGQDHLLSVRRNQRCGFPLDCMKYNSPIDAYNPDFKKFPEFRQARAISFTQEAGELLIIPTGWFHQAFNPVETMAISSQVMNSQNYKLVLEEIYKAGEVDPKNLPKHFHSLSAKQQVEAVVEIIPRDVISKGKMVTESLLNQLKWDGKGASINYKMT